MGVGLYSIMKTFIPDEIIATEYRDGKELVVRSGGCTAGCGLCCEYLVLPVDPKRPKPSLVDGQLALVLDPRVLNMPDERWDDTALWVSYHDMQLMRTDDLALAFLPEDTKLSFRQSGDWLACRIEIACDKLDRDADGDGYCGVFGTPERPNLCQRTPRHPLDVEGIKECTYKFGVTDDPKVAKVMILQATYERMKEEQVFGLSILEEELASERERGATAEQDSS